MTTLNIPAPTQNSEPRTQNSAPPPSVPSSNPLFERPIANVIADLIERKYFDHYFFDLKITRDQLREFLSSKQCNEELELRDALIAFQLRVHAQDFAQLAFLTLREVTNSKNPIAKRLAAQNLLELAGIHPEKPPTIVRHESTTGRFLPQSGCHVSDHNLGDQKHASCACTTPLHPCTPRPSFPPSVLNPQPSSLPPVPSVPLCLSASMPPPSFPRFLNSSFPSRLLRRFNLNSLLLLLILLLQLTSIAPAASWGGTALRFIGSLRTVRSMNAILLSIGDELASGLSVNTNSAWLAQQLATMGIRTAAHLTVADDLPAIAGAIRQACEQLELEPPASRPQQDLPDHGHEQGLLLITGGLGPTEDDLTREALADALGQELVEDPDAMLQVERFFKSVNRPMSPSNRRQALRPHGATIIENPAGTAPGLMVEKGQTRIFVMPGVPREMREMFMRSILPALQQELAGATETAEQVVTLAAKINTFGMGESTLGERIKDLMARNVSAARGTAAATAIVGTTVNDGIVSIRIYATGPRSHAEKMLGETRAIVRQRLGPFVFSEEEEPLEAVVAELLRQNRYTLATAESCTGGLLATLLTNTPGSSAYFLRGWITYANTAKHDELGVPEELITQHGAVSELVARAMAEGARKFAESDFAISTTGIAGPDGGSPEKPVGTVWIALASPTGTDARRFIFPGNRAMVRLRAAQMGLALLRWKLMDVPPPVY